MPPISNLILTNQLPIHTYTASVVTSASLVSGLAGNLIADGLGNQITLLAVTVSYAHTASIQTSWEESSSFASQSFWSTSASYASNSIWSVTSSWASSSVSSSHTITSSWAGLALASTSASWASHSLSSSYSDTSLTTSYASASVIGGGLTTIQYFDSGSPWFTMSFVNGILVSAS